MASESTPPPQPGGGGAKYAIVGVALFAIAALVWCVTRPAEPTAGDSGPAPIDAGVPQRSTALVEDEFEIPELEPDGGPLPDAGRGVVSQTKRPPGTTRSWDDCSGDIARAEAARIMSEHRSQITNCYERRLKQNPALEGNMTLSLRVGPDGNVEGTQVSGTLHDREVFACVRNAASHIRFPAPGGRDCALVQVPYTFTPRR